MSGENRPRATECGVAPLPRIDAPARPTPCNRRSTAQDTVMQTSPHATSSTPCCGFGPGRDRGPAGRGARCAADPVTAATRPLDEAARSALLAALDDAHRNRAFHLAVLDRFPGALPFVHVVEAEGRHVEAIAALLRAHGLAVPADVHAGSEAMRRAVPATLACACDIARECVIDNVDRFVDHRLPRVADHPAIVEVFTRVMEAARDRHLPAFRRWSAGHRFKRVLS